VSDKKPKPLVVQVMERSRARGTARQVLGGYAWFGNPDGSSIEVSPREVARKAGVSVGTVERYRPRLIELGELVVVRRDAHGEHVEYRIVLSGQNSQPADPGGSQNPQQRPQAADSGVNARERDHDPGNPGEDSKLSSPRGQRNEEPRADVDRLCELLAGLIAENGRPAHLIDWPSDGWRQAARLLLDRDGRDAAEAELLVRWCQADDFWRANVLGMPTFRQRFDQLRLQAKRNGRHLASVPSSDGRISKAERVDAEIAELLAEARGRS
jgi:hypothetical protein